MQIPLRGFAAGDLGRPFGEPVQFKYQSIDLSVNGLYLAFDRGLGRRAFGLSELPAQREHFLDKCYETVVKTAIIGIIGVDRTNGHIRHVLVDQPVAEFTSPRAKGYAKLPDRKPKEFAIEYSQEIRIIAAQAICGVGNVRPCGVKKKPRAFGDVRVYDFRAVQYIVIVARPQLPPKLALILPLPRRVRERFQMARYRRVLLLEPVPGFTLRWRSPADLPSGPTGGNHDQEPARIAGGVTTDILTAQERMDQTRARANLADHAPLLGPVDLERFIQSRLDAVEDATSDIPLEGYARCNDLLEHGVCARRLQGPSFRNQSGGSDVVFVLGHIGS